MRICLCWVCDAGRLLLPLEMPCILLELMLCCLACRHSGIIAPKLGELYSRHWPHRTHWKTALLQTACQTRCLLYAQAIKVYFC